MLAWQLDMLVVRLRGSPHSLGLNSTCSGVFPGHPLSLRSPLTASEMVSSFYFRISRFDWKSLWGYMLILHVCGATCLHYTIASQELE